MIISRTPLRISFVGGGSDIASYYRYSPGAVVSTAINKYIYIMVEKQFDGRIIAQYSKMEIVKKVSQIKNNLIREAMKLTGVDGGIHVTSISDIPSEGTGMGSSSVYLVGLLNALYAYRGMHVSAEQLAQEACRIEIDILKKPIGKQDQYIAAYGGLQYIEFHSDGGVKINPIICLSGTKKRLKKELLLFYTGLTRSADSILVKQRRSMEQEKDKIIVMNQMVGLAKRMREDLSSNSLHEFGKLLHMNWQLKKTMTDAVTTSQIDRWYKIARRHGAKGGKILGAGGGGFLLLFAEPQNHEIMRTCLSELIPLTFEFEPEGSKIIFVGE